MMGSRFMIVPFILALWGCGIGFVSSQPTLAEQRLANARRAVGKSKADYLEVINLAVTDDFVYQDPVLEVATRSGYRAFLERMFIFSPVYGLKISDDVYDGGDTYMCYWKMEGVTDVQIWFISATVDYSALGMSIVKFRPGEAQAYFQRDQFPKEIYGRTFRFRLAF